MGCFLHALKNYANFSGRAGRKEFWMFMLFAVLGMLVAIFIDVATGLFDPDLGMGIISGILNLALIIPSFSVSVRRLHDLGKSGWWIFLALLPVVNLIMFVYLGFFRGTEGPNEYGEAAAAC